jgi:diacylglycerol kinase (ATP)
MPQHKVKLIVNPNADLGQAWRKAADLRPVVEEFGGADWTGTVYPTHAIELARQAAEEGYELVISAGGDGTAHEVINGLMQVPTERRPPLGVVPLGSGNDFSHALGMNPQPALALRQIFTGKTRRIDIGRMSEGHGRVEYMDNTLGIGFDAPCSRPSSSTTMLLSCT